MLSAMYYTLIKYFNISVFWEDFHVQFCLVFFFFNLQKQ